MLLTPIPNCRASPWPVRLLPKEHTMTFHLALEPLLAILAGVLILIFPRLLNTIIAIYLIIYGVLSIVSP
jgi:threonine/homoserine efflux transporter RhtA